jgi:RimJ/RimL family protein N-acetyltransferase
MELKVLKRSDMPLILEERNNVLETLRTPFPLTLEQQFEYYDKVICDRNGTTRYFGIYDNEDFIGYGGLEHISQYNRDAEISVLIFSKYRQKGYGAKAVDLILDYGFSFLNLNFIYGEVYACANQGFWKKIIDKYKADNTVLPVRKYYNGRYWDSLYFTFNQVGFNK